MLAGKLLACPAKHHCLVPFLLHDVDANCASIGFHFVETQIMINYLIFFLVKQFFSLAKCVSILTNSKLKKLI